MMLGLGVMGVVMGGVVSNVMVWCVGAVLAYMIHNTLT